MDKVRNDEIEEARDVQQAMVPLQPLHAHSVEVACTFRPVSEVGGDFVDYFLLADHRVGLYLGDVVGKGLPAAIYGALAVGILRGVHKTGAPPNCVLELFNERLRMRHVPRRYCVVQYAVFDPASCELRYANAGLPRPLHISAGGCREVGDGGLPCGVFAGARYEQYIVRLARGDAVLFATDGVTDARDPAGNHFGLERLLEVCVQHNHESAETLVKRIVAGVDAFTAGQQADDDMTAAVLKLL